MKKNVLIAFVTVGCVAILCARFASARSATRPQASVATVEEPPPEPVTCPLCAGDPLLHARRMFQIETLAGDIAAGLLRW